MVSVPIFPLRSPPPNQAISFCSSEQSYLLGADTSDTYPCLRYAGVSFLHKDGLLVQPAYLELGIGIPVRHEVSGCLMVSVPISQLKIIEMSFCVLKYN